MTVLVTGSSGHLGDALVRVLRAAGEPVTGLDVRPSASTDVVGSVADAALVERLVGEADAVVHAATLHKPHVGSHAKQDFVEVNVTGTLRLLEAAERAGGRRFVFVSTTSAFGRALRPAPGEPAAWITEAVQPRVRNVYGATKVAAEDLCELAHAEHGLPVVVLRTSRFFPEGDDSEAARAAYDDRNLKVCELLYRRVDLADVVQACRLALDRAPALGFGRYVVSATTPFEPEDAAGLGTDAPAVLDRRVPGWRAVFEPRGWRMLPVLDRVYDNAAARRDLGWRPTYDFARALDLVAAGEDPGSPLARQVGAKGYHAEPTGVYTPERP